jgi:hypothetical protein
MHQFTTEAAAALKAPLQNPAIERSILGALMLFPNEIERHAELITPNHFTCLPNRLLWDVIVQEWRTSGSADADILAHQLDAAGHLEVVGGSEALLAILEGVPHAGNLGREVEVLHELYVRRQVRDELRERLAVVSDVGQHWPEVARKLGEPIVAEGGRGASTLTAAELVAAHPEQREPLFDGLLRRGEVGTLVAPSKCGKSWLTYGAALAFVTGERWLGTFATPTGGGRVLLLDNELSPETLGFRLRRVSKSLGVDLGQLGERLRIATFRGRRCFLGDVASAIRSAGGVDLVVIDAAYRAYPPDFSENDNAQITGFFSTLVEIAETAQAGLLLIHHSTKGEQSGKSVRDVGAGAGAWSRATDLHIGLREHEAPDAVVFDGIVRSSPPIVPFVLQFDRDSMRWERNDELDPTALRGGRKSPEARESEKQAREEARRQATRDKQDQRVESVFNVHARTWLSPNQIKAHAGLSGAVVSESVVRLLARKVIVSRLSAKRAGAVEYLLTSSLAEVTEFERQATGRDDSPPHPPDDCPVPSAATGGSIAGQDSPVCPVRPVRGRKQAKQEGKQQRGKQARKQRHASPEGKRRSRGKSPEQSPEVVPEVIPAAVGDWQGEAVQTFVGAS